VAVITPANPSTANPARRRFDDCIPAEEREQTIGEMMRGGPFARLIPYLNNYVLIEMEGWEAEWDGKVGRGKNIRCGVT
jgi:hypothetical protein